MAVTTADLDEELASLLSAAWQDTAERVEHGGSSGRPVLLPYRSSASADGALDATISLFAASSVRVRVLHVWEWQLTRAGPIDRETRADATASTTQAVTRLRRNGVSAEGVVRYARHDRVHHQVLAEARAIGASIIVLGARRRAPLLVSLGRTTRSVLRQAACPVLLARPTPRRGPPLPPVLPGERRSRWRGP